MSNPLRRKQAFRTILDTLQMAGGYAVEESRLAAFANDLIRPPLTLGEFGVVMRDLSLNKHIRMVEDPLDVELKQWVITELGRSYLASLA